MPVAAAAASAQQQRKKKAAPVDTPVDDGWTRVKKGTPSVPEARKKEDKDIVELCVPSNTRAGGVMIHEPKTCSVPFSWLRHLSPDGKKQITERRRINWCFADLQGDPCQRDEPCKFAHIIPERRAQLRRLLGLNIETGGDIILATCAQRECKVPASWLELRTDSARRQMARHKRVSWCLKERVGADSRCTPSDCDFAHIIAERREEVFERLKAACDERWPIEANTVIARGLRGQAAEQVLAAAREFGPVIRCLHVTKQPYLFFCEFAEKEAADAVTANAVVLPCGVAANFSRAPGPINEGAQGVAYFREALRPAAKRPAVERKQLPVGAAPAASGGGRGDSSSRRTVPAPQRQQQQQQQQPTPTVVRRAEAPSVSKPPPPAAQPSVEVRRPAPKAAAPVGAPATRPTPTAPVTPDPQEKRVDAADGQAYGYADFLQEYGADEGHRKWSASEPATVGGGRLGTPPPTEERTPPRAAQQRAPGPPPPAVPEPQPTQGLGEDLLSGMMPYIAGEGDHVDPYSNEMYDDTGKEHPPELLPGSPEPSWPQPPPIHSSEGSPPSPSDDISASFPGGGGDDWPSQLRRWLAERGCKPQADTDFIPKLLRTGVDSLDDLRELATDPELGAHFEECIPGVLHRRKIKAAFAVPPSR